MAEDAVMVRHRSDGGGDKDSNRHYLEFEPSLMLKRAFTEYA